VTGLGAITAATPAASAPGARPGAASLHEAAVRLEGLFLSQLVDQMLNSAGLPGSQPVYAGLLAEKLGDHLAAVGGIGLAALVERQLGADAGGGEAR
jgi:Rod binding domain-containing protein